MNNFLIDTNIFKHTIDENIYGVACHCKSIEKEMCVTNTILIELNPGVNADCDYEKEHGICVCVKNMINRYQVINLIDMKCVEGANAEYKKIRSRHYSWTTQATYLQHLIQTNKLEAADIKNLKYKDAGECELLAIAKASEGNFALVTNDKGRVFLHPYENIFEFYKEDPHVNIFNGGEWIAHINYKEQ